MVTHRWHFNLKCGGTAAGGEEKPQREHDGSPTDSPSELRFLSMRWLPESTPSGSREVRSSFYSRSCGGEAGLADAWGAAPARERPGGRSSPFGAAPRTWGRSSGPLPRRSCIVPFVVTTVGA